MEKGCHSLRCLEWTKDEGFSSRGKIFQKKVPEERKTSSPLGTKESKTNLPEKQRGSLYFWRKEKKPTGFFKEFFFFATLAPTDVLINLTMILLFLLVTQLETRKLRSSNRRK